MNAGGIGDAQQIPLPPGDDEFQDHQHAGQPGPQFNPGQQPFFPWWYGPQQFQQPANMQFMQQQQPVIPTPQPHRVRLVPLWTQKAKMWFSLAESSFETNYVTDSRAKFNLVLAALSEETLDRVKALVEMPEQLADPYGALKLRIVEIYEPDVWQTTAQLLHMRELGDMQPSQLMDSMLALLPAGETTGVLFKTIFLERLPGDMRDHVQASARELDCRELATLADNIWRSRNARKPSMLANLPAHVPHSEEEAEVNAVDSRRGKQPASKQSFKRGDKKKEFMQICWKHQRFGDKAHNCVDSQQCAWKPSLN